VRRYRAGIAALGTLCLVACAVSAEEQVLTRFFEASRALDSTQLYRLGTVILNPRVDGSVQTFSIAERRGDERAPLVDARREQARRSLSAARGEDVDLTGTSVEMITREVTVDASLRTPDGAVRPAVLLVTLEKAVATTSGSVVEGRWIVTRLQRAPDARTSRAASSAPRS
jgi:cytidylate kinase